MVAQQINRFLNAGAAGLLAVLMIAGPSYAKGGGYQTGSKTVTKSQVRVKPLVPPPTISPAFTYPAASHVAHGASLRNRKASTINLSGLPSDAVIIQAFLYWDFTSLTSVTSKQTNLCFG